MYATRLHHPYMGSEMQSRMRAARDCWLGLAWLDLPTATPRPLDQSPPTPLAADDFLAVIPQILARPHIADSDSVCIVCLIPGLEGPELVLVRWVLGAHAAAVPIVSHDEAAEAVAVADEDFLVGHCQLPYPSLSEMGGKEITLGREIQRN